MTETKEWAEKTALMINKAVRAYAGAPHKPSASAVMKYRDGLWRYARIQRLSEVTRWQNKTTGQCNSTR